VKHEPIQWTPAVAQKEATKVLRQLANLQTRRRSTKRKLRLLENDVRVKKKEARAILSAAFRDRDDDQLPPKWKKTFGKR